MKNLSRGPNQAPPPYVTTRKTQGIPDRQY